MVYSLVATHTARVLALPSGAEHAADDAARRRGAVGAATLGVLPHLQTDLLHDRRLPAAW